MWGVLISAVAIVLLGAGGFWGILQRSPLTYFSDGRDGYDVQYMTQKELIADMLKQYERYLSLLAGVGQELMRHEQVELAE